MTGVCIVLSPFLTVLLALLLLGVFTCVGSSLPLLARRMLCLQQTELDSGRASGKMHIGREVHLLPWLSASSSLPPSRGQVPPGQTC